MNKGNLKDLYKEHISIDDDYKGYGGDIGTCYIQCDPGFEYLIPMYIKDNQDTLNMMSLFSKLDRPLYGCNFDDYVVVTITAKIIGRNAHNIFNNGIRYYNIARPHSTARGDFEDFKLGAWVSNISCYHSSDGRMMMSLNDYDFSDGSAMSRIPKFKYAYLYEVDDDWNFRPLGTYKAVANASVAMPKGQENMDTAHWGYLVVKYTKGDEWHLIDFDGNDVLTEELTEFKMMTPEAYAETTPIFSFRVDDDPRYFYMTMEDGIVRDGESGDPVYELMN